MRGSLRMDCWKNPGPSRPWTGQRGAGEVLVPVSPQGHPGNKRPVPEPTLPLLEGGPHPSKRVQPTQDPDAPEIRPHCFICGPPQSIVLARQRPQPPFTTEGGRLHVLTSLLSAHLRRDFQNPCSRGPRPQQTCPLPSPARRPRKPPTGTPRAPLNPSVFPGVSASTHSAAEQTKSRAQRQLVPDSSCFPLLEQGSGRERGRGGARARGARTSLPSSPTTLAGTVGTSRRSVGTHSCAHRHPGHSTVYPPSHRWRDTKEHSWQGVEIISTI